MKAPAAPKSAPRRFRRLMLAGLLVGVLTLAAGLYTTRGWTLPAVGRFLNVAEAPRPVDYAMVLGGGIDKRPFVAAALVKRGLAREVLVPTVKPTPDAEDGVGPDETTLTRNLLIARGVPADSVVLLPGEVNSTRDEADALARFLKSRPDSTVAVVTTDYHTRRARWVFGRVLGERMSRVSFVAAPTEEYNASDWWQCEDGFVAYLDELTKLAYYRLKY